MALGCEIQIPLEVRVTEKLAEGLDQIALENMEDIGVYDALDNDCMR